MTKPSLRYLFAALLLAVTGSSDADLASMIEDCDGCHGTDGISQWTDMPTIAGASVFLLSDDMYFYRDRARPCATSDYRQGDTSRPATDMCAVAAKMTDAEIEAIAAYYAKLPFKPARQDFDGALADRGRAIHDQECENCHADSGRDPDEDAGILAGQWMTYMRAQFTDFIAGKRSQPRKMKVSLERLSADDVEALLHFYASLQ
ncbi:MAG: cytochrome c-553 [Gammaproteobacteria bacterium]|nr:cytochrome c-553 [Gammaproteobacteria bacterium]